MNKVLGGLLLGMGGIGGLLGVTAARHVSTIRPNVTVAGVALGGMTTEEAARALRIWWESEKLNPLDIKSGKLGFTIPKYKPSELGVTLDDVGTVAKLPTQDIASEVQGAVTRDTYAARQFDPIFKSNGQAPIALEAFLKKAIGTPKPARILYTSAGIKRQPEVTAQRLDQEALVEAVAKAYRFDQSVELPLEEAPKRIADDQLAQISEVVAEYKTHFPKRQYNRNQNIKLASGRLNGVILLPGEQLSFNKTVGERTEKQGFMLAGVYKNGKHDTGIGGGICQVSTTLYNAALYANLKIVRRSNHSMPVAYVPLGRDATVDWGSLDLVLQNNFSTPIAVSSEFEPGTLTFRILGKKVPGEWVKIVQVGGKSWDRSVQVVHDPKLSPGAKVVIEKGSKGHAIKTYRIVYKDGAIVSKQFLGNSYYGGGDRIIAVGPTPSMPAPLTSGVRAGFSAPRLTGG